MSHTKKYSCGDCHFIALKRHLSKCQNSCAKCGLYHKKDYVCKHHVRDYCSNDNVVGTIDRTYPACEAEFILSGSSAKIYPMKRPDIGRERRDQDVA